MKASWARGFSRHIGSRTVPGKSSDTLATRLIVALARKKRLRAVTPPGRVSDMVFFRYNVRSEQMG